MHRGRTRLVAAAGVGVLVALAATTLAQEVSQTSAEPPAAAEPATRGRSAIEEIVVTAQKREQTLREVPISMSVVTGDFLKQENIADFRDLSKFAGNVSMIVESSAGNNWGGGPNIRIRGFGTAYGADTFEQPVGMAIDGDSYSKLPLFLGGLFDVDRVEILKGPQGTLFGKNTTAGLVNVTTASPSEEYTGFVDARIGNYESRRFEGAVGGPVVSQFLEFRVAGLSEERDGWTENTTVTRFFPNVPPPDGEEGALDRKGVRFKADVPNVLGASLRLSQEFSEIDSVGSVSEWVLTGANQGPLNYQRKYDPLADFELENKVNSFDVPQLVTTRTRRFIANPAYELAGWGLNALVGLAKFETTGVLDGDGFAAPVGTVHQATEQPQTNLEFRVSSPELGGFLGLGNLFGLSLGSSEFMVGFFYQRRKFDYFNQWVHSPEKIGEYASVLSTGEFPPVPPGSGTPPDPASLAERPTIFVEKARSIAGFGQLSWSPVERWTLEFGARFTHESKEGVWDITAKKPQDQFWNGPGFGFFSTSAERSESGFTPRVSLKYDVTDEVSVFAARSVGFKSGGLNANPSQNTPESLAFEPERATSWEVGGKTRLFDGTMTLDAALFWMDVTELQSQVLESGNVGPTTVPLFSNFRVLNAGEARSRGAEVDLNWLPTEWFALRGVLGLADTKYLSFPNGTCANDVSDPDPEVPGCDLAGRPFEYTPRWMVTITPSLRRALVSLPGLAGIFTALGVPTDVEISGGPTVEYVDVYKASRALDPRSRQPSFFRIGANAGLGDPSRGWSLSVGGQNLTNEYVFDDVFFNLRNAKLVTPAPPRMIVGGVRWDF